RSGQCLAVMDAPRGQRRKGETSSVPLRNDLPNSVEHGIALSAFTRLLTLHRLVRRRPAGNQAEGAGARRTDKKILGLLLHLRLPEPSVWESSSRHERREIIEEKRPSGKRVPQPEGPSRAFCRSARRSSAAAARSAAGTHS